ncbi:MAG: FxsA family protein [Myxococcota bacterium]
MGKLFLLFTVVPFVELYLLLLIGRVLGALPTLLLVIGTGFVGAWLARSEGLRVVRQWQKALAEGRVPEEGVLGGLLVLVGGVLLITPGVLTDAVGLLLLFPSTRTVLVDVLRRHLERKIREGDIHVVTYTRDVRSRSEQVIDVEGEDVTGDPDRPPRPLADENGRP